ncbi:6-phosphogluconolactonase [Patescibacteria group bacterium]|nr:6-phosphogluconolactonase [Patescibacteria group bacterium]MBU2259826.1 6-phosphogluconolactonase [Patescibacteria group bacterium]
MLNYIKAQSEADFTKSGVQVLKEFIQRAITQRGRCILGLSGGSTPQLIYEKLGKEDIDWSKLTIFLVDERYIASDDEKSNQKMVCETLLKNASIPESNIIFPNTQLSPEECVADYASRLKKMIDEQGWLPDVVTLGLGEDGHIASLFPPIQPSTINRQQSTAQSLVLHTQTNRFEVKDRITLTLNVIASAQNHIFFLKGKGKKKVWDEMMESKEDEKRWPAKRVLESEETTVVYTECS